MKKLFYLIFVLTVFFACSNDDDTEDYSLVGTVWANYEDGTRTIEFVTSSTFVLSFSGVTIDGENEGEFTGIYEYEHPKVVFIYDGERIVATVTGNSITLGTMNFTKQ